MYRVATTLFGIAAAIAAHAGPLTVNPEGSGPLPLFTASQTEILSYSTGYSSCGFSESRGSYDATTGLWAQSLPCDDPVGFSYVVPTGRTDDAVILGGSHLSLAAQMNVDDPGGEVLSGSFIWEGTIPGAGIDEPTLLAVGSVLDAWYGNYSGAFDTQLTVLIELDFLVEPLESLDIGKLLHWTVWGPGPWGSCDHQACTPWQTSTSYFADSTTSDDLFFLSQSILKVAEPSTWILVLLGMIAAIALSGKADPQRG